jgi:hypothetical protein
LVVVVYKLFKPFACAGPTADPEVVKTVDAHFERVKPLFDEVSVCIAYPTVES